MNQGENAPPMHPRCRCTIVAYMEGVGRGERVAGRTRVSEDVTYRQWLMKFDLQRFSDADVVKLNIKGFGEAHISLAKLTKCALNPVKAPDKAIAFEQALGYNLGNVNKLIDNIVNHINNFEMIEVPDLGFGRRFRVTLEITGENGKTAKVLLAWIIDKNTGELRLTSIYVDKK